MANWFRLWEKKRGLRRTGSRLAASTGEWLFFAGLFLAGAMSLTAVALAFSKWRRMKRMTTATRRFTPAFAAALERRDLDGAVELSGAHPESHVARVLGPALRSARSWLRSSG